MTELPPETRDLFYPSPSEFVDGATRIGKDLEADILVLESGRVIARLDDTEWLINTTLERYRQSLEVVGRTRDQLAEEDDEALVAELKAELERIDPEALAEPDSYWANILEQIELEQF